MQSYDLFEIEEDYRCSWTYDNSLAGLFYLTAYALFEELGDFSSAQFYLEKAESIIDELIRTQNEDGSWYMAYNVYDLPGTKSPAWGVWPREEKHMGSIAWAGLLLANYYGLFYNDSSKQERLNNIIDASSKTLQWILSHQQMDEDKPCYGAFFGGEGYSGKPLDWASIEHNTAVQAFLITVYRLTGCSLYKERAQLSARWMVRPVEEGGMWLGDHFAVGVLNREGEINDGLTQYGGGDAQIRAFLSLKATEDVLGIYPENYSSAFDWLVYNWILKGPVKVKIQGEEYQLYGVPYILLDAGTESATVWNEETEAMIAILRLLNLQGEFYNNDIYYFIIKQVLDHLSQGGVRHIVGGPESQIGTWPYWPYPGITSTVWSLAAAIGVNLYTPFKLPQLTTPETQAFATKGISKMSRVDTYQPLEPCKGLTEEEIRQLQEIIDSEGTPWQEVIIAAQKLAFHNTEKSLNILLLSHRPQIRMFGLQYLYNRSNDWHKEEKMITRVIEMLGDENDFVKKEAIRTLGRFADYNYENNTLLYPAVTHLEMFLSDERAPRELKIWAEDTLGRIERMARNSSSPVKAEGVHRQVARLLNSRAYYSSSYPSSPIKKGKQNITVRGSFLAGMIAGLTAVVGLVVSYSLAVFNPLSFPILAVAGIIGLGSLLPIYSSVLFFSQGLRVAYALAKHGGIRGSPLFTAPIAYVENSQIEYHPAFNKLHPNIQKSIQIHEQAHQKGYGEIGAYFAQVKGILFFASNIVSILGLSAVVFHFIV